MDKLTNKDEQEVIVLLEFIPTLEDENFDPVDKEKPIDPFATNYSEEADSFISKVISHYWLKLDYNIDHAKKFIQDRSLIKDASLDDIKHIFSYLQRGERFCPGVFLDAFEKGIILDCLYRLKSFLNIT